ncbi:hypothetical protein J6590_097274 [Homalodisca vitripennis]|nr:hypothetical protein J6590_097274 [Homalodisca vitripennis]
MGVVDLMHHNISNYRIDVRGKRWYIPIVLSLFDVMMSHSWFLARSQGALLQKFGHAPKATGPTRALKRASNPLRRDHGGHLIVTGQSRRRGIIGNPNAIYYDLASQRILPKRFLY